jgi:hypothetical protein
MLLLLLMPLYHIQSYKFYHADESTKILVLGKIQQEQTLVSLDLLQSQNHQILHLMI